MKKMKASRVVAVFLMVLCVLLVGLIALGFLNKKKAPETVPAPAGQAMPAPGGQAPAGNAARNAAGGQQDSGSRNNAGPSQSGAAAAGGTPPGPPAPGGAAARPTNRNATIVRVAPVTQGDIRRSVVINGDVLAGSQVSVNPTVAGKLAESFVKIGDYVRSGQAVASVDPSRPGEVYSKSPVSAPISGTVLSAPANIGDSVNVQTAIFTIGDLGSLILETYVPERFTTYLHRGLSAEVSFEAMPGELFKAEVYEVSPVLDPASRTTRIRLRFSTRDPRIRVGMFGTVHLVTQQSLNVTVIPRIALINTAGNWICYVINTRNIAERRQLSLGLESEDTVEIKSGVSPGEQVVVAGQNFLSDNEQVRIVE